MVYNRIIVQYSPDALLNLKIYDGPGRLSPDINITMKSQVTLSSYQGFVTYTARIQDNITAAYVFANNQSSINSSLLNWISEYSYKGFRNHPLFLLTRKSCYMNNKRALHFHGSSGKCFLSSFHGIITVHQMIYTGVNMLRHSPSTTSPSCQYGGLFVFMMNPYSNVLHHSRNYIAICSNVLSKTIIPVIRLEHSENLEYHFGVMFVTFKGYSSGFVDLTLQEDKECFGTNVAIARGPSCNNYFNHWTDIANSIMKLEVKHCSDVWLLNEIDLFESSPFENCTFTLDHAEVGFPIGTYKMIISASVIHQSSFSAESIAKDLIKLDIQTFIDLNTANQFTVSVTLADLNEYTLNISSYTKFTLNWLGYDQFPVFIIRVQFIENRICSPTVILRVQDRYTFDESIIYKIEDVSDVYLSSRHPYDQLSAFVNYEGYNRGTCRALVVGHMCLHSMSHYQIIQIHYRPHKYLALPHEIDISMKKTAHCAYACALDVDILEYKDFNGTRKTRYHEWKSIYHVTWQVIATNSRGFSVTINTTCTTCTKLCDVAVALGLPLTTSKKFYANVTYARYVPHVTAKTKNFTTTNVDVKYLDHIEWLLFNLFHHKYDLSFGEFQSILQILSSVQPYVASYSMYGSWYDAHAYCKVRNASLFTLQPSHFGHLIDTVNSVDPGWKNYPQHYFAGLHRTDVVCISTFVSHQLKILSTGQTFKVAPVEG